MWFGAVKSGRGESLGEGFGTRRQLCGRWLAAAGPVAPGPGNRTLGSGLPPFGQTEGNELRPGMRDSD